MPKQSTPLWHRLLVLGLIAAALPSVAPVAVAEDGESPETLQSFELGTEGFREVEAPDPNSPEGRLHAIRKAIAEDRADEAVDMASDWIDEHPNHPLLAEAYLLRGDAKSSMRHFYDALFDYELLLRRYPGSDQFQAALRREFKIAQAFGRGVKRRLWGMRILPAYGEAEELLIRIQERSPGSDLAERAGIELADFYYRRSEMASAADAYDLFLENHPRSQWRQHAMRRQVLANLAMFKGPRFDTAGLIEARQRLSNFQQQFPAAAEQIGAESLMTRINETLATSALLSAQWYERRNDPVAAKFLYKRLIRDHPGSVASRKAMERLRELDPEMFAEATDRPSSAAADRPSPRKDRAGDTGSPAEPSASSDASDPSTAPGTPES